MSVFAWRCTASLLCFFLPLKRSDPTMQCSFGSLNQHNKGPDLVISGVEMFPKPLSVLSAMSACGGIKVCGSRLSLLVHVGKVFYLTGIVMITGNVHVPQRCCYQVTGTCRRVPAGQERLSFETFHKKSKTVCLSMCAQPVILEMWIKSFKKISRPAIVYYRTNDLKKKKKKISPRDFFKDLFFCIFAFLPLL